MKKLLTFLFLISVVFAKAQYTTPGTGVNWNLDSLVVHSAGAVTFNTTHYEVTSVVTIAATDKLSILDNVKVVFHDTTGIISEGTLIINPSEQAIFTAIDSTSTVKWRGIRLLSDHVTHIKNATFEFGGGLRVQSGEFSIDNSTFYKNFYKSGSAAGSYTSSAALDIAGTASITNCNFLENDRGAIASGSNQSTRAWIYNNYIFGNSTQNTNRPQINMGPTGEGDTTFIIKNTVIGNGYTRVGGIAFSSLLGIPSNVVIDSNIVDKNRYGITITGSPISGAIRFNTITDNNIENNPNLGGSGINLTASAAAAIQNTIITGNTISGNLWGITVVGNGQVNMGNSDPDAFNPGGNVFADNGNNGILCDFYNNGPKEQFAMYNCWNVATQDSASIEGVVTHIADINTLGLVHFMPSCAYQTNFHVYNVDGQPLEGANIIVEGLDGNLISNAEGIAFGMLPKGNHNITCQLSGYEDYQGTVNVENWTNDFTITLNYKAYTIGFSVYNQSNDPIAGAVISINSETLTTDTTGYATLELFNGTYPFTITKEGYHNYTGECVVSGNNFTNAITMISSTAPIYNLTFEAKDESGTALEGVKIEIEGIAEALFTNNLGIATAQLPDGVYNYTAQLLDYENIADSVTVNGEDVTENITMTLIKKYKLKFIVMPAIIVKETSFYVEDATIEINNTTLTTDENGEAEIYLPNGVYPYTVKAVGFFDNEGEVTIANADKVEEVLLMPTGGSVNQIDIAKYIYPNPVDNILNLDFEKAVDLDIYTINGKLILSKTNVSKEINLSNIKSGTYVLQIRKDNQIFVTKIVKK